MKLLLFVLVVVGLVLCVREIILYKSPSERAAISRACWQDYQITHDDVLYFRCDQKAQ